MTTRCGGMQTRERATVTASSYTADEYVHFIEASAASNSVTINLPASSNHEGRVYHIKRTDTQELYTVTIDPNGSESIDGTMLTYVLDEGESICLISDGTGNWWIIGKFGTMTLEFQVFDWDVKIRAGSYIVGSCIPTTWNGKWLLERVDAAVYSTGGSSGNTTIDVYLKEGATGPNSMLDADLALAYNSYSGSTKDVNASYDGVQSGDLVLISVAGIPSGGAPDGLWVTLTFRSSAP